jgi:hypothetical protein
MTLPISSNRRTQNSRSKSFEELPENRREECPQHTSTTATVARNLPNDALLFRLVWIPAASTTAIIPRFPCKITIYCAEGSTVIVMSSQSPKVDTAVCISAALPLALVALIFQWGDRLRVQSSHFSVAEAVFYQPRHQLH